MTRTIKSRLLLVCGAFCALILYPSRAEAHLNSTGLGPGYDGLLHFLRSPEDFVPVIALALFTGLRGTVYSRRVLFVLPAAWLVSGFIGLSTKVSGDALLTAISLLILGGLVAADAKLSLRATTAIAALLGFVHGYMNGGSINGLEVGAVALLGIVSGVFILVAVVAAFILRLRRPWTLIASRVVGSWIAARSPAPCWREVPRTVHFCDKD